MVLQAAKDALTVSVSNKESEVVISVNTMEEAIRLFELVSKQKRQLYQPSFGRKEANSSEVRTQHHHQFTQISVMSTPCV